MYNLLNRVCANGGTVNDDTLHMGFDNTAYSTSVIMAGYDANAWQWRSIRIGGNSIPSISTSAGHHYIDVWMREDGLKINRILLTPDFGYSPSQIRCGSY